MELNFTEQIRIILKRQGHNIEWLADKLGMSRQNLSQQMKRANFKENDMKRIAAALDCNVIVEVEEKPPEAGENTP